MVSSTVTDICSSKIRMGVSFLVLPPGDSEASRSEVAGSGSIFLIASKLV